MSFGPSSKGLRRPVQGLAKIVQELVTEVLSWLQVKGKDEGA